VILFALLRLLRLNHDTAAYRGHFQQPAHQLAEGEGKKANIVTVGDMTRNGFATSPGKPAVAAAASRSHDDVPVPRPQGGFGARQKGRDLIGLLQGSSTQSYTGHSVPMGDAAHSKFAL